MADKPKPQTGAPKGKAKSKTPAPPASNEGTRKPMR